MCSRERGFKLLGGVIKRGFLLKLHSALCVRFWSHSTLQPLLYEGQVSLQVWSLPIL